MKLSVALATYNGEEFIIKQLESVLDQSMKIDEVIIHDDRSKDNTVAVVEKYIKDNNLEDIVKISVNEVNLGYASNFISALDETTGDLIFFCDQDDIWVPGRVAEMVDIMNANDNIKLLCSEFACFVDSEDALSVPKWETKKFLGDKTVEHITWKPNNIFIGAQGCTMCLRREFYNDIKNYWYKGWAHDEFVWKLALCMDGLYMYHSATLNRRLHANNVSLKKMRDIEKRIMFLEELLKSHEATLKFAKDHNLSAKQIKLLNRNIKATKLRIDLMKDKKYFNVFKLTICYFNCYHKSRSIPVELLMAIKDK